MAHAKPQRIRSIGEFHRLRGLPKPEHPLISIVTTDDFIGQPDQIAMNFVFDFYFIALKKVEGVKYKYGQLHYDFEDDGVLFFMSPNQVLELEIAEIQVGCCSFTRILSGTRHWQKTLSSMHFLIIR